MQERNTREIEQMEPVNPEDIKIHLQGNPILIKEFQTQLESLAQSFASLLVL